MSSHLVKLAHDSVLARISMEQVCRPQVDSIVILKESPCAAAVIAYRIWASNRLLQSTGMSGSGRSLLVCHTRYNKSAVYNLELPPLQEAMAIFIESAALYTYVSKHFNCSLLT